MTTHDAQIPLPYRIDMEYIDSRFLRYRVFIKYCVWDISMPYRCVLNIVLILSISSNYLKTKKSVVMWSHVYSWCHQKKPFSLYMTTLHDYTFINNYSFLFEVSPFDMTRLHMTHDQCAFKHMYIFPKILRRMVWWSWSHTHARGWVKMQHSKGMLLIITLPTVTVYFFLSKFYDHICFSHSKY